MTSCSNVLVESDSLVLRCKEALLAAELDCGCRDFARTALDRIVTEGALIQAENYLSEGRSRREAIRRFMDFLSELDEFGEAASAGAVAVRRAAASIRASRAAQEVAL